MESFAGMPYLIRLEKEIKNAAAAIVNGVVMRHDHPSHGYTKTNLRRDLHRLEGMLTAWLVVSGNWDHPGTPMLTQDALRAVEGSLGIHLTVLRGAVETS